ncbi:MAG: hypothetical protein Kow00108_19640 [Calditrichia bacterium]
MNKIHFMFALFLLFPISLSAQIAYPMQIKTDDNTNKEIKTFYMQVQEMFAQDSRFDLGHHQSGTFVVWLAAKKEKNYIMYSVTMTIFSPELGIHIYVCSNVGFQDADVSSEGVKSIIEYIHQSIIRFQSQ